MNARHRPAIVQFGTGTADVLADGELHHLRREPGSPISALLEPLICDRDVCVIVDPSVIRTRRIRADLPVGGILGNATVMEAAAALVQDEDPDSATVLYAQPASFILDGHAYSLPPVGRHADQFALEGIVLTAAQPALLPIDETIAACGGTLRDLLAPQVVQAAVGDPDTAQLSIRIMARHTVVTVQREDRLAACGTLQAGWQHVLADLSAAGVDSDHADSAARRVMLSPWDEVVPMADVVDARLSDFFSFAEQVVRTDPSGMPPSVLTIGEHAPTRRLRTLIEAKWGVSGQSMDRGSAPGPTAATMAAAMQVLSGDRGVHERAGFSGMPVPPRGVLGWLRTRF